MRARGVTTGGHVDKSRDVVIFTAMFGRRIVRFSARRGISRAGVSAILALWCLFSLASGTTQALCLDFGPECAPSASAPAVPCHDQTPGGGRDSSCGSCVDILIPEDASVARSRPDSDLRPLGAAPSLAAANAALGALEDAVASTATHPVGLPPLHPAPSTTVLRI